MPTPCDCPPETTQTPCAPKPCVQENCVCPVLIKSDCVNNINVDTPCVNIPKGLPFNEWMPLAFTKLCDKFAAIQGYFTLQNVGVGVGKLFAGIALTGERKIKSILGSNLITITDQTEEVKVDINQTALTTLITSLIPPPTSSDTGSNVGTGLGLVFRDKVANVFNFRKIKTSNTGAGASILNVESNVSDDVVISAKKLKSTNGSVTITENANDIDFSVLAGTIPDGSETKVTAGTNVTVTGTGTTINPYVINGISNNPQKEIKNDYTLSNSDNNYVFFVDNTSTNITITIPAGLVANFQCGFIQEATFETTFVAGVGVTLNNPIGFRIKGQKYNVFLEKKLATETYYLLGNTKV